MTSFFENIDKLDLKEVMDETLRKQVDYPWPKEAICLEGHGLLEARNVLDIGTGNGHFLCRLAERYPDKRFTGVEVSEPLVELARDNVRERGLNNVELLHGKCPVDECRGPYDLVLARLSLYCDPKRDDVLRWAHGLLNRGGRLAIIDTDDGWMYAHPHDEILHKLFETLSSTFKADDVDRFIGRKLPGLLRKNGYSDIKFEVKTWYSNFEMDPEEFVDLYRGYGLIARKSAGELFTDEDLGLYEEWMYRMVEPDGDGVAIITMFVASGAV